METETKEQYIKVVIAVPCGNPPIMNAKTANAIGCNIIRSGKVIDYMIRISCDVVANRTWLVQEAIKKGGTHILFVDTDMYFPADTLDMLLAHDKDIVGVEYNKRKFPLEPVFPHPPESSETELYKTSTGAGTGLLLIKLSVFEKITNDAWFNFGRDSQGQTTLGEDAWFCNVARDAGFDVWVDPTIRVGHIGEFTY